MEDAKSKDGRGVDEVPPHHPQPSRALHLSFRPCRTADRRSRTAAAPVNWTVSRIGDYPAPRSCLHRCIRDGCAVVRKNVGAVSPRASLVGGRKWSAVCELGGPRERAVCACVFLQVSRRRLTEASLSEAECWQLTRRTWLAEKLLIATGVYVGMSRYGSGQRRQRKSGALSEFSPSG